MVAFSAKAMGSRRRVVIRLVVWAAIVFIRHVAVHVHGRSGNRILMRSRLDLHGDPLQGDAGHQENQEEFV